MFPRNLAISFRAIFPWRSLCVRCRGALACVQLFFFVWERAGGRRGQERFYPEEISDHCRSNCPRLFLGRSAAGKLFLCVIRGRRSERLVLEEKCQTHKLPSSRGKQHGVTVVLSSQVDPVNLHGTSFGKVLAVEDVSRNSLLNFQREWHDPWRALLRSPCDNK